MSDEISIVKKTETAFDDVCDLWKRRKWVCLIVLIVIAAPVARTAYLEFVIIPNLEKRLGSLSDDNVAAINSLKDSHRKEVDGLQHENDRLMHERDKAQTQLAPFLAAANRGFPNSGENERLDRLISVVEKLGSDLEKSLPLEFTDEQRKKLFDTIKQLTAIEDEGSKVSRIRLLKFPGQSSDAAEFTDLLQRAFELSGRKVDAQVNIGIKTIELNATTPWDGVVIQVYERDIEKTPPLAVGLMNLFKEIGLSCKIVAGEGFGPDSVTIYAHRLSARAK